MIVFMRDYKKMKIDFNLIFDIDEIQNLNVGFSFVFHIRHSLINCLIQFDVRNPTIKVWIFV